MKIAVDFDGTIVEHRFPEIGRELPFAIETLKKLARDGHELILWTSREGKLLDDAVNFCRERGLEFYAVNCEYPNRGWDGKMSTRKVRVDIFIDDRQIGGLPEWTEIYEYISDPDFRPAYYGTHGSRHHGKKHRHGLFSGLKRRCREARGRFNR